MIQIQMIKTGPYKISRNLLERSGNPACGAARFFNFQPVVCWYAEILESGM
jgi:hypothetical protein